MITKGYVDKNNTISGHWRMYDGKEWTWIPYSPTRPNYVKKIEGSPSDVSPYVKYPYYLTIPPLDEGLLGAKIDYSFLYTEPKIYINKKKRTIVVKRGKQTVKVKCSKDTEWNERLGVLEALYQLNHGGTKSQAKKELQTLIDNARREE